MQFNILLMLTLALRICNAGTSFSSQDTQSNVGLLDSELNKQYNMLRNEKEEFISIYKDEYIRKIAKIDLYKKMTKELNLFKKIERKKKRKNKKLEKLPSKVIVKTHDVQLNEYIPKTVKVRSYKKELYKTSQILDLQDDGYTLLKTTNLTKMKLSPTFIRRGLRPSISRNSELSYLLNKNIVKKGLTHIRNKLYEEFDNRVTFSEVMKHKILQISKNKQNVLEIIKEDMIINPPYIINEKELKKFEVKYDKLVKYMNNEYKDMVKFDVCGNNEKLPNKDNQQSSSKDNQQSSSKDNEQSSSKDNQQSSSKDNQQSSSKDNHQISSKDNQQLPGKIKDKKSRIDNAMCSEPHCSQIKNCKIIQNRCICKQWAEDFKNKSSQYLECLARNENEANKECSKYSIKCASYWKTVFPTCDCFIYMDFNEEIDRSMNKNTNTYEKTIYVGMGLFVSCTLLVIVYLSYKSLKAEETHTTALNLIENPMKQFADVAGKYVEDDSDDIQIVDLLTKCGGIFEDPTIDIL